MLEPDSTQVHMVSAGMAGNDGSSSPSLLSVCHCVSYLPACRGSLNHLWVYLKQNKKKTFNLSPSDRFHHFPPILFVSVKYPSVSPHCPPTPTLPRSFSIYMCGMVGSSPILRLVNAQSMLKLNNTFCKWWFMYRFIEKLHMKDLTESTI